MFFCVCFNQLKQRALKTPSKKRKKRLLALKRLMQALPSSLKKRDGVTYNLSAFLLNTLSLYNDAHKCAANIATMFLL
jgi:hypothetical protein